MEKKRYVRAFLYSLIILTAVILFFIPVGCDDDYDSDNQTDNSTDNVTVSIPPDIEQNCIGFLSANPVELKTIAMTGAAWTRPHPGPFVWGWIEPQQGSPDYSEADKWVTGSQHEGVALLGTIWPFAEWDQKQCRDESCQVSTQDEFYFPGENMGIPASRCAPCSYTNYASFVKNLVERYDGDGVNDMPGLTLPIKYWEILNEPSMNEETLTFFIGSASEYVTILQESYAAIKETCPDCNVVQGGAAGTEQWMTDFWNEVFENGGADYFDIANIHHISQGDESTFNVKDFKALLDRHGISKPIWVTEAQVSSEETARPSAQGALEAGASNIIFTRLVIGSTGPPAPGQYSDVYDGITDICN